MRIYIDRQFINHIRAQPGIDCVGIKYLIQSIKSNESFHPKMVLLFGPENAKQLVGSRNLITPGLVGNYEYFSEFEYNRDNIKHLNIDQSAYRNFSDLYEIAGNYADLVSIVNELDNESLTYDYFNHRLASETENVLHQMLCEHMIQSELVFTYGVFIENTVQYLIQCNSTNLVQTNQDRHTQTVEMITAVWHALRSN